MTRKGLRAGVLLAVAALCGGPVVSATESAAPVPVRFEIPPEYALQPQEDWYGVYARGNKVGYLHVSYRPEEKSGRPVLILDQEAAFQVESDPARVAIRLR